jgi:hypothetical protein
VSVGGWRGGRGACPKYDTGKNARFARILLDAHSQKFHWGCSSNGRAHA